MDLEVVRQSATNIPSQPMEERPQRPPLFERFQTSEPIRAGVLPETKASVDKTDMKLIKKLAGLEADKVVNEFENSADRSAEELEKRVSEARRNGLSKRVSMGEPAVGNFPRPLPVIKPSDIKKSIEEDKKFFGNTFGERRMLPVQGGRIGINWDAQLRRMG